MERMTLQEAAEIAKKRAPINYCFGGSAIRYKRITEVGIWYDERGEGHPFATLLDKGERSTLRTKLRYVERVSKSGDADERDEEPLLNEETPSKLIYVCSPYNPRIADEAATRRLMAKNLHNAELFSRAVAEQGATPIAPHLLFTRFMDDTDPAERDLGLKMAKQLLRFCDELRVFGDMITEGMRSEINLAKELHIPIVTVKQSEVDKIITADAERRKNKADKEDHLT